MKKNAADDEFIAAIQSGGSKRERAVERLIDQYAGYMHKVRQKLGLGEMEIQDAYTDAIIVVVNHIENNTFKGESKLSTFLYRIFYNKCVDVFRKNSTNKSSAQISYELPEIEDPTQSMLVKMSIQEERHNLERLMDQLGEKCKQILLDWGFWGYSMQEIAERNGLKHADSAKKQKYKCLQKLMKFVSTKANHHAS